VLQNNTVKTTQRDSNRHEKEHIGIRKIFESIFLMREEELSFPINFSEPWFDMLSELLHSSIIQRATTVACICCIDYTRPNETGFVFC
jgi:hypothetical protein